MSQGLMLNGEKKPIAKKLPSTRFQACKSLKMTTVVMENKLMIAKGYG